MTCMIHGWVLSFRSGALDGARPPAQMAALLSSAWRRPEERNKRTAAQLSSGLESR